MTKQNKFYAICDELSDGSGSWTISTHKDAPGWVTDSGYALYGLSKEMAEWIVRVLNESAQECPFQTRK